MTRPAEIVRKICPKAKPAYLAAFEAGDGLFKQHGVTTPLRLAHFMAQVCHETGGLTVERESGSYSAPRIVEVFGAEPRKSNGAPHHSASVTAAEAARLAHDGPALFERVYGLGNPGKAKELGNTRPGDGWLFRGNGMMQTTGGGNHKRMGAKCGVDFYNHPELVLSAEHALKPALAEWTEGDLNAAADRNDILTITKRINGGTNGLDYRKAWLAKITPLIDKVDLVDAPKPTPIAKPAAAAVVVTTVAAGAAHTAGLSGSTILFIALAAFAAVAAGIVIWSNR